MAKKAVRNDGRIVQRVTLPDGTKKDVYAHSVTELKEKVRATLKAAEQGVKMRDRTTVEGWAKQWLETYKAKARYNTKQMYITLLGKHILPEIGGMELKKVCPVDIQQILNKSQNWEIKNKKGEVVKSGETSYTMLKKILMTLDQIFKTAMSNHLINCNPCTDITIGRPQKVAKIKYLSDKQQKELLNVVKGTRAELFVALGLYAGLRREESLALTWLDIDWDKKKIKVHNTVEFGTNQSKIMPLTKTAAGQRTLPIAPPLMDILNTYNPQHVDTGKTVVKYKGKRKPLVIVSQMLCPAADGEVMSKSSYKRMWEVVTKRLSFKVTSHMLRHTCCTAFHEAGIDLRTTQYFMGHSDIRMTAKIYTHIENKTIESAQAKIEKLYDSQSKSQSRENAKRADTDGIRG